MATVGVKGLIIGLHCFGALEVVTRSRAIYNSTR